MPEPRHTGDNASMSVLLKLCFDHGVDIDELSTVVENSLRQPGHHRRSDVLSDNGRALSGGRLDRAGRDVVGVIGVAVTQPSLKARCTHPAQPVRSLVAGQQNECALAVREVESPFQGWEILQQLSAQTVDRPVPIRCEVIAACA